MDIFGFKNEIPEDEDPQDAIVRAAVNDAWQELLARTRSVPVALEPNPTAHEGGTKGDQRRADQTGAAGRMVLGEKHADRLKVRGVTGHGKRELKEDPSGPSLSKWNFLVSFAAVAALDLLWAPSYLRHLSNALASRSGIFGIVFSAVFFTVWGAFFGIGHFFVIRAHVRCPKDARWLYHYPCNRHKRIGCETCLQREWNLHRSFIWSIVAFDYYFFWFFFGPLFMYRSSTINSLGFMMSTGVGLLLVFRLSGNLGLEPPRNLAMSWGFLRSHGSRIFRTHQIVLFVSWLALLTRSISSDDLKFTKLLLASVVLYFIAIFWLVKYKALYRNFNPAST